MQKSASSEDQGWFTRDRLLTLLLIAATLLVIYLCYQIALPFLPALAWALAFAVVTHPINDWFQRRIKRPGIAAGLAVAVVVICVVTPMVFVGQQLFSQIAAGVETMREDAASGRWRSAIQNNPQLAPLLQWAEEKINIPAEADKAVRGVASRASQFVTGSVWALTLMLIAILTLFYFFRDQSSILRALRSMLPFSERETNQVFQRITDTIFATVFGSLTVAAAQGILAGLMFWWLGLPAPVLWGSVMAVLAVIPMAGAFIVWIPAAIFLAIEGSVGKAIILIAWGMTAVGLIDNLLYPVLVGKRLRVHPLPVFFSIVGGIMLFGAAGLILGPLALALLLALTDVWRRRTVAGQPAEQEVSNSPAAT